MNSEGPNSAEDCTVQGLEKSGRLQSAFTERTHTYSAAIQEAKRTPNLFLWILDTTQPRQLRAKLHNYADHELGQNSHELNHFPHRLMAAVGNLLTQALQGPIQIRTRQGEIPVFLPVPFSLS